VIPKGQKVSSTFYIQAFSPAGTASLQFSGGSYSISGAAITLAPTAFVFKEAAQPQPVTQSLGSTVNYTLIPTVLSPGTPPPAPFAMRPYFGEGEINVASSNPGVAALQTTAAYFSGGDQQQFIAVKAVSSGSTTLTLSGAPYLLNTPQSTLTLVVH